MGVIEPEFCRCDEIHSCEIYSSKIWLWDEGVFCFLQNAPSSFVKQAFL